MGWSPRSGDRDYQPRVRGERCREGGRTLATTSEQVLLGRPLRKRESFAAAFDRAILLTGGLDTNTPIGIQIMMRASASTGEGRPLTHRVLVPIVCGVVAALVLTIGSLPGVLPTASSHAVCAPGLELGWSGPLAVPIATSVAPPGGYVVSNLWLNTTSGTSRGITGDGVYGTWNNTVVQVETFNWTLYSTHESFRPGPGSVESCPQYTLVAGLPLGNATPSSWGIAPPLSNTSTTIDPIPTTFTYWGNQSAVFPAGSPTLVGWFALDAYGNAETHFTGAYVHLRLAPWFGTNGPSSGGWSISVVVSGGEVGYDVPFHLFSSGELQVAANDTEALPSSSIGHTLTYEFPEVPDHGTWYVFVPPVGPSGGIGGLLFQHVSDTWPSDTPEVAG